jgi:hypothetical protein
MPEIEPMTTIATRTHRWTEDEDVVTLYLHRHGDETLPMKQAEIANRFGIPKGSLGMRKRNFAYLDGRGRLNHPAKMSRRVHDRLGRLNEPELRALVLRVLQGKR